MIKVLFFIPGLSEGGAEKVLCNLVNNMDQSKFDITVQTVESYNHEKYLVPGIHYKSIFHSKSNLGRKIANLWYRFCTELKLTYPLYIKDDYDIEVAYLECGATKVMAASTNKKATKLAWVHCDLKKKGITGEKVGRYYSQYDKAVCVSDDVKLTFDELFGKYVSSVILHNVIDEDEIYLKASQSIMWEKNPNEKQLLAVGRLSLQKNFSHLINASKKLKESGYQFHLNILGEGSERENLEKQIIGLGLEGVVELKGFTQNPYPWMKNADLIVCSSKYEGISTVVQEALLLGRPVITTPCTGMRELLGDSEYGFIVDSTVDGLYLGLEKFFKEQNLEGYYAVRAKERSNLLKKKNVVKETENFFINEFNQV